MNQIIFQKRYWTLRYEAVDSNTKKLYYVLMPSLSITIVLLSIISAALNYFQSPIFFSLSIILLSISILIFGHQFPYGFGFIKISRDYFVFNSIGQLTPFFTPKAKLFLNQKLIINYYPKEKSMRCIQNNVISDLNLNGLKNKDLMQMIENLKNDKMIQMKINQEH